MHFTKKNLLQNFWFWLPSLVIRTRIIELVIYKAIKNSTTTFHFHSVRKEFCFNKYEEKRFFMFYIFFFVVVVNFTQMYILAKVFAKTRSFIASVAAATFLNKLSRPWIEVRLLIYLLKEKFIWASSNYFGWSFVVSGNWPLSCAMYLDNLACRNF